MKSLRALNFLS